ncbi:MAG: hypothetical protein LRZ85_10350 [Alphaproteobacteria bacterium]|nr:hypothetical protein [Alphaproteobacteria bacterium]MCD8520601.1 hypothetical protein [Alphaproteobacteria bacterium]MCD8526218.1 hypothetical protein [Alphaproteobacteria bacterium]MCD8571406.1 hypothetical protein [Alphaproteobacteria bacterium]
MKLTLLSFGYKNGPAPEANILMDVRFLQNPYWVEKLRPLTGKDKAAGAYIAADPAFADFMRDFKTLLETVIPRYQEDGKEELVTAVGCTGGRHRSVYVVEQIAAWARTHTPPLTVHVKHRELD